MMQRFRETNAHPLWQRMRRTLRRLRGAVGVKTHQVHFVRTDGRLCKRIRFEKNSDAIAVESALFEIGPSSALPAVLRRDGRELWLEYVEGPRFHPARHEGAALLPEFYASLYARAARGCSTGATAYPARLKDDLHWLEASGILSAPAVSSLARRAAALEPEHVLLGFEFIDPVPKNFVIRNGHMVGVDVEALRTDTLLGTGPAKALLRWLDMGSEEMSRRLLQAGAPDLSAQFEYAGLCFRCSYARQKILQRKPHLAPVSMFDPYLGGVAAVTPRALVAQSVKA